MSDMCTDNHMDYSLAKQLFKEYSFYKHCDKNKGDVCDHPKCQYSKLILCQHSYFECGRRE